MRLRQLAALSRPVARSIRWGPLAGSVMIAAPITHLLTRDPCLEGGSPDACLVVSDRLLALRLAAVLIALGAAFLLDDPAEEATAHLPTPRLLTRIQRLALAAPALVAGWALCLGLGLRTWIGPRPFPWGAVTLEFSAILSVALAASIASARFVPERLGGLAGGPILLAFVAAGLLLPPRLALFVSDPVAARWPGSHELWWVVLGVGVLLVAGASRDPGRRPWLRRRPGRTEEMPVPAVLQEARRDT